MRLGSGPRSLPGSDLLRRAGPFLLLLWFLLMDYLYLRPWQFAIDAHIYYRAADALVSGGDPWQAEYAGYLFAAAPPSLVPYLPLTLLPEDAAVALWMVAGFGAAFVALHRLGLPWWWIAFPPLAQALLVGNAQPIVLALLVMARAPLTALAAIFKLYAAVPALGNVRHVIAVLAVLAATWLVLPWGEYLARLPELTERLDSQALGGFSAYGEPLLMAASVIALLLLLRKGWQWHAVPAIWPATQLHYSVFFLPVVTPLMAAALAIPIRGLPPLCVIAVAATTILRERGVVASVRSRLSGAKPGAGHEVIAGDR